MTYVLLILLAWMVISAFVCVCVCMAAGRFAGFRQPGVTRTRSQAEATRPGDIARGRAVDATR